MKPLGLLALPILFPPMASAASYPDPSPQQLGVVMADIPQPAPKGVPSEKPKASSPQASACPGSDALFLPTGLSFPALLPNAVYSFNMIAPAIAEIEDDVKFRGRVVLPRGTRLIGSASTLHTLDRVNITWQLAVLPAGCEFAFDGLSLSADDGSAGIKGEVQTHKGSVAAQVALKSALNVAGAAAAAAAPVEGALASGLTAQASQGLDETMTKVDNLESIYIHERTEIRVLVLRRFTRAPEEP